MLTKKYCVMCKTKGIMFANVDSITVFICRLRDFNGSLFIKDTLCIITLHFESLT